MIISIYFKSFFLRISPPKHKNNVILAGNGSIIKNDFYRKSLNDALQFDIKDLHWIFSDISCAYSAGIIAANCKNIDISINNVIQHIN